MIVGNKMIGLAPMLLIPVLGICQVFELTVNNPAPRVGDNIFVSYQISKNDPDSLEIINDSVYDIFAESMNVVGDGHLIISEWYLSEPGPLVIGPFEIQVNGRKYTSTKLKLHVSPKLPDNILNGVWIRYTQLDSVEYIILEQRQPAQVTKSMDDHGRMSNSATAANLDWAYLNLGMILRKGYIVEVKNYHNDLQMTDIGWAALRTTVYFHLPQPGKQLHIERKMLTKLADNVNVNIQDREY